MEEQNKEYIKGQVKEQMEELKEKFTGKKSKGFLLKHALKLIVGLSTLVLTLGAGLIYMIIGQGGEE